MKRILILGAVLLSGMLALGAQTVDRDEFADLVAKTINFVNYSGSYARIDTLDQILAIGRSLSQGIAKDKDSQGVYGERYRILHVMGRPEEPGKPADILILTERAGVDHIDNIRRIISSYLSATYGYAKADADILAVFVTVYNAVHRGNLVFFQGRYKPSVATHLSADKVGLSIRYSDWPGKTQILIPLSTGLAAGGKEPTLSSVSAKDLVTPEVVETIRDKPGAGTKERQQLADLMDRTVDETQNKIDQQKADLAKDKAATDARLAEVKSQLDKTPAASPATADKAAAQPATGPATSEAPVAESSTGTDKAAAQPADSPAAAAADQAKALKDERKQLEDKQAAIAAQEKQLENAQAENAETAKAAQELRDSTAADLKNQGQENAAANATVFVIKTRLEKGMILGTAQKVVPATSEVLAESKTSALVGRRAEQFGDGLLSMEYDGTASALVLLNPADLALVKKGATVISPYSELAVLPGGAECLAVMQQDGEWYLGRFDNQLNPVARSAIPVDPVGALTVKGGVVLIQRKDGRITSLNLSDLRASK
jgi:hypothetical protein